MIWPDGDDSCDDVAHDGSPTLWFGQLWRACQDGVQALADVGDHGLDLISAGMGECHQQACLSGMRGLTCDPGQQQRAGGDGFEKQRAVQLFFCKYSEVMSSG